MTHPVTQDLIAFSMGFCQAQVWRTANITHPVDLHFLPAAANHSPGDLEFLFAHAILLAAVLLALLSHPPCSEPMILICLAGLDAILEAYWSASDSATRLTQQVLGGHVTQNCFALLSRGKLSRMSSLPS